MSHAAYIMRHVSGKCTLLIYIYESCHTKDGSCQIHNESCPKESLTPNMNLDSKGQFGKSCHIDNESCPIDNESCPKESLTPNMNLDSKGQFGYRSALN